GSRVVSFLPQVPRRRHDSLGNAALLPANPAILSPPGCQKCVLPPRPPGQEGSAGNEPAGFDFGSRIPLQPPVSAQVGSKRPPANAGLQWSFGFDGRF